MMIVKNLKKHQTYRMIQILARASCCIVWLISFLSFATAMPDNGVANVPPMGWNAWYAYFRDVNEFAMMEAADQMVQLGLRDLGYTYVNLDDSWMSSERDPITHSLVPNATKFPRGFTFLANYIHERGLKMGVYSSAGTMTCVSLPGSLYHEVEDAQALASWGIDFLKYDNCYGDGLSDIVRHTAMRNALNATGRQILFSLCNAGQNDIWRWAPQVGNMWRSTTDILRTWKTIEPNYWNNQQHIERMPFGIFTHSWPDPDMLQIGVDQFGQLLPLSEQRSQFGLWVLAKAPLILSTNLTKLAPESLDIIKNPRLIALHQNPVYPPARCYIGCRDNTNPEKDIGNSSFWSPYSILATHNTFDPHRTSDITVAVIMNWNNTTLANFTLYLHDIGIVPMPPHNQLVVTDLWTGSIIHTRKINGGSRTAITHHERRCRQNKQQIGMSVGNSNRAAMRGSTSKKAVVTTKSDFLYDSIPVEIPSLEPHDNVIYQFETTVVAVDDDDNEEHYNAVDCEGMDEEEAETSID